MELPEQGSYATGILFLDPNEKLREESQRLFEDAAAALDLKVFAWRDIPKNASCLGSVAQNSEPFLVQVFVKGADSGSMDRDEEGDPLENSVLERRCYILRKSITHQMAKDEKRFYVCSLSTKTIVYKGQFNPCQLWQYFDDLTDPDFLTYLCIVHTRFSTNTFPSWERAHPNR